MSNTSKFYKWQTIPRFVPLATMIHRRDQMNACSRLGSGKIGACLTMAFGVVFLWGSPAQAARRGTNAPELPSQTKTNLVQKTAPEHKDARVYEANKFMGLLLPDITGPCWVVHHYGHESVHGVKVNFNAVTHAVVWSSLWFNQEMAQLQMDKIKEQQQWMKAHKMPEDPPPSMVRFENPRAAISAMANPPFNDRSWEGKRAVRPNLPALIRTRVEELREKQASHTWQQSQEGTWITIKGQQLLGQRQVKVPGKLKKKTETLDLTTNVIAGHEAPHRPGSLGIPRSLDPPMPAPPIQVNTAGLILTHSGFKVASLTTNAVAPYSKACNLRFWIRHVLTEDIEVTEPLRGLWASRTGGGFSSWLSRPSRLRVRCGTGDELRFDDNDEKLLLDGKWHAVEIAAKRLKNTAWVNGTNRHLLDRWNPEPLGIEMESSGAILLADVQVLQTEPTRTRPRLTPKMK